MRVTLFILLLSLVSFITPLMAETLPPGCEYDKLCLIELPGSVCGDGSQSYYSLIAKRNSNDLLIYLEPGGACWSAETCVYPHVAKLSNKPPSAPFFSEDGLLDLSNPTNPLFNFSRITVPYCTGDVFLGDSDTNYGDASHPNIVHHRGFKNALLTMEAARKYFPNPRRVVLFGRSAGGLGVLAQLRNLDSVFPRALKFALADAGTPLAPPFVDETNYMKIIDSWNAYTTLPSPSSSQDMKSFGDLLKFNTVHYPHIRYGLIQSYDDRVMTYFAKSIGSADSSQAVRKSIILASNEDIGLDTPHAKVFFISGKKHILTKTSLSKLKSAGWNLKDWLHLMFTHQPWPNIRPDLE